MSLRIEAVLATAASQVGVHEVGGNDLGPQIEEYQASCNLPPGSPWCACLVHWCLKQNNIPLEPATGDTWAIRDWAKDKGILYDSNPVRGDIFLLLDNDGEPEHTGFVTDNDVETQSFDSIEGNTTDPSGVFPGKGVYRKVRPDNWCEYVRWDAL